MFPNIMSVTYDDVLSSAREVQKTCEDASKSVERTKPTAEDFQKKVDKARDGLRPEALMKNLSGPDLQPPCSRIHVLFAGSGKEAEEIVAALEDDIAKLPEYLTVAILGGCIYVQIDLDPDKKTYEQVYDAVKMHVASERHLKTHPVARSPAESEAGVRNKLRTAREHLRPNILFTFRHCVTIRETDALMHIVTADSREQAEDIWKALRDDIKNMPQSMDILRSNESFFVCFKDL